MKNKYKIVKILDEYTVIVNAGESAGIKTGDEFQILDEKGSDVLDPDTGEVLGSLDLIKATVLVTEVQERMSFCSSPTYTTMQPDFFNTFQKISTALPTATKQDKLNVDLKEITGGLRKSNEKVRVGDSVRLIKSSK